MLLELLQTTLISPELSIFKNACFALLGQFRVTYNILLKTRTLIKIQKNFWQTKKYRKNSEQEKKNKTHNPGNTFDKTTRICQNKQQVVNGCQKPDSEGAHQTSQSREFLSGVGLGPFQSRPFQGHHQPQPKRRQKQPAGTPGDSVRTGSLTWKVAGLETLVAQS